MMKDDKYYYAIIPAVPMGSNINVAHGVVEKMITVHTDKKIKGAIWLDNGMKVQMDSKNSFMLCCI